MSYVGHCSYFAGPKYELNNHMAIEGFLHIFYPSPDSQTPHVFCGWLQKPSETCPKPRGRQGFSESLLRLWSSVGLELRQSVFGVLKRGGWMG